MKRDPLRCGPGHSNPGLLLSALLGLWSLVLVSCVQVIQHNQDLAAANALEFAKAAFIERNTEKAYPLLSKEAQKVLSSQQFSESLMRLHPSGWPSRVTANEYEPIPGQRGRHIYLSGQINSATIYYLITMGGTAKDGYRVVNFASRSDLPPPTKLRQLLPTQRSVGSRSWLPSLALPVQYKE